MGRSQSSVLSPQSSPTLRVTASINQAAHACEQLAREWHAEGLGPTTEDLAIRAIARALREIGGFEGHIELLTLNPGAAPATIAHAANLRFRDAVSDRVASVANPDEAECTLTSFAAAGIDEATPRLARGRPFAFTMGAERTVPGGERTVTVAMAYDGSMVSDPVAARVLSRVRNLIEAPCALLAD